MSQLDGRNASVGAEKLSDSSKRRDVRVRPDAEVAGRDAAFGRDSGGFSEHDASATDGASAEVYEVPVAGKTVDRTVLAHGRDADAVGQRERTLGERSEEMGR